MSIAERINSPALSTPSTRVGTREGSPTERRWNAVRFDGQPVLIREIRTPDGGSERRLREQLPATPCRFRFLGTLVSPSDDLPDHLVILNPSRDIALIALICEGDEQSKSAVGALSMEGDGSCRFVVTVADEWHNKGLGTLLMQHLICIAMDRGIKSVHSIDAADNEPMRKFAAHLVFKRALDPNDATRVVHSLDLSARRIQ